MDTTKSAQRAMSWGLLLLVSVLTLTRTDVAAAQSAGTLFFLVHSESDLKKSAIEQRLTVPFHWLETDQVAVIAQSIKDELPDFSTMTESEVQAQMQALQVRTKTVLDAWQADMKRAYQEAAVAGEISVRFGVVDLPAIVEITHDGYFRKIEGFSQVLEAVRQLEALPYQHESDLIPRGSDDRAGGLRKVSMGNTDQPSARERFNPRSGNGRAVDCDTFDPTGLLSLGDGVLHLAAPGGGYCGTGAPKESSYSFVDALIDASLPKSFNCMDLTLSGICLYVTVRVYCSLLGCSVDVKPEASIELTHFNPDALVGISKRLGYSPIKEAELLLGKLQNKLSKVIVDALMHPIGAPPQYEDTDQYAGVGSESGEHKSTMLYHEVDIIGHPGTIFEFIDENGVDFAGFQQKIAAIPGNVIDGTIGGTDQITGNRASDNLNDIYANADDIHDLPGWEDFPSFDPTQASLVTIAELIFPGDMVAVFQRLLQLSGFVDTATDAWELIATADMETLTNLMSDTVNALAPEDFTEAVEVYDALLLAIDGISGVPGLGGSTIDLWKFCPSNAQVMKPYFMSGLDIVQWRFNIPEITFPETYALPLPGTDKYVGLGQGFSDSSATRPEGDSLSISATVQQFTSLFGAWGSVYPRQGFVSQTDEMKAAAVAGFRAAHVITRPNQKHIYNYLRPKITKYLDVKHPPPLSPVDAASGMWQPVAPEFVEQCEVFGDNDGFLDSWSRDKQSDDRAYGYALWRQYTCCPSPQRAGATFWHVQDLGTIPMTIKLM